MPAPTIVTSYSTDYTTTGASKNVSISCNAGDSIVIIALGGKNTTISTTPPTPTTAGSSSQGNGTLGGVHIFWGVRVSAQTNRTITITESGGTDYWGFTCFVVRNCFAVNALSLANGTGTAPNRSFASRFSRSLFLVPVVDSTGTDGSSRVWRTVDGTTPTSANGFELLYERVAGNLGAYICSLPITSQGTKTGGLTSPTMTWKATSVELVGDDCVFPENAAVAGSVFAASTTRTANVPLPAYKANFCLIAYASVGVQPANGTDAGITTTMSLAGRALTSVAKIHSNGGSQGYIEVFYLVDPPTGTQTLTLTASSSADLQMYSMPLGNVDQANPIAEIVTASGSSTTCSLSFTAAKSRDLTYVAMVSTGNISGASSGGNGATAGALINNNNNSSDAGCNAYHAISFPVQAQSASWTVANGPWAVVGVRLSPASYFPAGAVYGITG